MRFSTDGRKTLIGLSGLLKSSPMRASETLYIYIYVSLTRYIRIITLCYILGRPEDAGPNL